MVGGPAVADHPPAARRAVIRRLKSGDHPVEVAKDAVSITDPGHAAVAMVHVAGDERLPAAKAAELVRKATARIQTLDRPGRMPETWGDVLENAASIHRGPETDAALDTLRAAAVDAVERLPDGDWVTDTITAIASYVDGEGRKRLLRRGLHNPGGELAIAKALLGQGPGLADIIRDHAPPEVASRLLAKTEGATSDDALAAAWAILDMPQRREALRVLSTKLDRPHELMALGGSAKGRDPADRVACWTMVGARLDHLGHDPASAFEHAVRALGEMDGKEAVKAHRKLAQAMERSGLDAPPAPDAPATEDAPSESIQVPTEGHSRHAFCLVDGYSGGLGAPHLRAIARAAPLCVAFELDLVLMGFPTEDREALVDLVDAESDVGEGEGYAHRLLAEGRLRLLPLKSGLPEAWPGTPVATTPHPADGKAVALRDVEPPLALLVGLGKNGLPKRMLNAVPHHHELTGRGISMETATAMGILADRLGRLPA